MTVLGVGLVYISAPASADMQRLWSWVLSSFFESASSADVGSASGRIRLNRSGQVALGLLITGIAGLAYAYSWILTGSLASQWQICLQLRPGSALQADYNQTLVMVDSLTYATQPQKNRLKQQLREVVLRLDGVCSVVVFYRSQESALLAVATLAFSLLSYAIVIGLPQGLANVQNRTLQVVIGTSGFLGVLSVAFLQLGQQDVNVKANHSNYRLNHALLVDLQTSLANQQLTVGQAVPEPLGSSAAVAVLIRSVDSRLAFSPVFSFGIDETAAMQMYDRLTNGDNGKGVQSPPGAPASAGAGLVEPSSGRAGPDQPPAP